MSGPITFLPFDYETMEVRVMAHAKIIRDDVFKSDVRDGEGVVVSVYVPTFGLKKLLSAVGLPEPRAGLIVRDDIAAVMNSFGSGPTQTAALMALKIKSRNFADALVVAFRTSGTQAVRDMMLEVLNEHPKFHTRGARVWKKLRDAHR